MITLNIYLLISLNNIIRQKTIKSFVIYDYVSILPHNIDYVVYAYYNK